MKNAREILEAINRGSVENALRLLVESAQFQDEQIGNGLEGYTKVTKTYADFSVADTESIIPLVTLEVNQSLEMVCQLKTSFDNGGSTINLNVEGAGDSDMLQPPTDSPLFSATTPFDFNNIREINMTLTSDVDLDQLTQGEFTIWYKIKTLP